MRLKDNQSGVVSMIVSITIMIIISLLIISFARLMRTEQEQALDRQLSAQAYYAAEAAVNDARNAFFAGELEPERTECQTDSGPLSQNELLSGGVSEYTCVTLDSQPNTLVYDNVSVDRSTITEIRAFNDTGDPEDISEITIAWEDPDRNTNFATGTSFEFPSFDDWNGGADRISPGVLRVDIVPLPAAGYDREYLRDNTQVMFLYPSEDGGNTHAWSAAIGDQGRVLSGRCSANPTGLRHCQTTISGLPLNAGDSYLLRMRSIYTRSSVTVSAQLGSGGNASFGDAQLVIDATGQSQNVLRRVEERSPLAFTYDFPEFALDIGNDLCKRLNVAGDTQWDDIVDSSVAGVSACRP